jgi:aminoglycoside N3'-acetyltransferase
VKRYDLDEFRQALAAVGVGPGSGVMVHSALFALGLLQGAEPSDIPATLAGELLGYLGPEGTVVAPTYTYDDHSFFDRFRARQMGQLSEFIADREDACRTGHSIISVAAVGGRSREVCAADGLSAFGPDGPFEAMAAMDFTLLLLGADMQAVTLVHVAEERARVPYRFFKEFPGEKPYVMFVRDLERYPELHLERTQPWLEEAGVLAQARLGTGWVRAVGFRDYLQVVERKLRAEPLALVTPEAPSEG